MGAPCIVQLIAGNRCSGGIALLNEEFAIPVSSLDDGCVVIIGIHRVGSLLLGPSKTSGMVDLGFPTTVTDGPPNVVAESASAEELGYPRQADEAAVGMDRRVHVGAEEDENLGQEVRR